VLLYCPKQGILKGEVSLYHWPPVWLVRNQLYDYWQFLFLLAKQSNPNQSNRRSMVQWYFPPLVFPVQRLQRPIPFFCLAPTLRRTKIFPFFFEQHLFFGCFVFRQSLPLLYFVTGKTQTQKCLRSGAAKVKILNKGLFD
jgi:hypothetical protein